MLALVAGQLDVVHKPCCVYLLYLQEYWLWGHLHLGSQRCETGWLPVFWRQPSCHLRTANLQSRWNPQKPACWFQSCTQFLLLHTTCYAVQLSTMLMQCMLSVRLFRYFGRYGDGRSKSTTLSAKDAIAAKILKFAQKYPVVLFELLPDRCNTRFTRWLTVLRHSNVFCDFIVSCDCVFFCHLYNAISWA